MQSPQDIVVEHSPVELRAELEAMTDLDAQLDELVLQARDAWPDVEVPRDDFFRYVAVRLPVSDGARGALTRLRGNDLYLACACASGDERAIAAFRDHFLPGIRSTVARAAPNDVVDEMTQLLMVKLFVASPERPAVIGKFQGRGALSAWVQVMATRDTFKLLKREARFPQDIDALANQIIEGDDPELMRLKANCRTLFKQAFQKSFQLLTPRQRNILRHEHLDGLNIDKIGDLYGVHRATVARWRQKARESLFAHTREIVESEMDIGPSEFDSVLRLIESQVEVSLDRLLDQDE
jgi:RNA polymerase sigma-70 factor (ECF subfamily)